MAGILSYPYDRAEHLDKNSAVATYLVFGMTEANALEKAGGFAVGQTIGTWVKVPGVSGEMVERYQGRVAGLYPAGTVGDAPVFLLRLAFPVENFCGSFTMMMTALVGNDVSTALSTRLLDLEFQGEIPFHGPRQGMDELRALTGVRGRPLVLNMIKPCTGFSPEEGAKLFFEAAKGGVDLIKDDELLGSPAYNRVYTRVRACLKAAGSAAEYCGKRALYLPNISGTPKQMRENAKAVLEAGARACLVNFVFGGLDALAELAEEFGDRMFIMAHYAGSGVMGGERGGIADNVLLGLLPRLAGASAVMTPHPNGADAAAMFSFLRTVQAQGLPVPGIRKAVTAVGGGVTPVNQERIQRILGKDVIIGIGGAVQGHPMGTAAGAQAAVAAVEATAKGIPLAEAAVSCPSLGEALRLWSA